MSEITTPLIAVDIGNSRIKLARFDRPVPVHDLPRPVASLDLTLTSPAGDFDVEPLSNWCRQHVAGPAEWWASTVHRGALEQLDAALAAIARTLATEWQLREIKFLDVPLVVEVDAPERVGMDRLMGAVAADRLRPSNRAAIVIDLGTATKVTLLTEVGAFIGGAIMPGLSMSAAALHQQTDALPLIAVEHWQTAPRPLGKSTVPAMESGIFWGAVGAIRELVAKYSQGFDKPPALFVTGGNAGLVAEELAKDVSLDLEHVPHLVLSGVAIVEGAKNNGAVESR